MRVIALQKLTEDVFAPYGAYYRLRDVQPSTRIGLVFSDRVILQRPLKLGITAAQPAQPITTMMERHVSTEEILFAGDKPIIITLANCSPYENPKSEAVVAFLLKQGDVVSLKPGIWHDACKAVDGGWTYYYFMACNNGDPGETRWIPLQGETVCVDVGQEEESRCN